MANLPSQSDRGSSGSLPHPILVVLWGALAAGVGEFLLRLIASQVQTTPVFLNPATSLTGPLSALLIFAPCAAVAWGIARWRGRGAELVAIMTTVVFLAVLDVLMLLPRIHLVSLVVLAAGVAFAAHALVSRWPRASSRGLRSSALALGVVAVAGWPLTAQFGRSGDGSGAEPSSSAPNVLLLVLDTVRSLELSVYGYERPTSPTLERIAAEGVRFDRAVATAPWTLPTHASLFTGKYHRDLSLGWQTPLDSTTRTLAEVFAERGYATAGFIANMRYTTREYGLARGFAEYGDYAISRSQVLGSTMLGRAVLLRYNELFGKHVLPGRKNAQLVIDEFLDWHRSSDARPFFAFVNLFDAHEPYAPDPPYDEMFGDEPPTRAIDPRRVYSPEEVAGLKDAYDGAIASVDAQLGRLFNTLQRRKVLDRTIVIVTSDHGEEFGLHGHLSHGNGLHFPALFVPLLVRYPRAVPVAVVEQPVSLRDIPQTILELAGITDSIIPGFPLTRLWAGGGSADSISPILSELYWAPNVPGRYPVSRGNMHSLVRGRYHLIRGPGDDEELYDIKADPYELRNLITHAEHAAARDEMRAVLRALPMANRGDS